MDERWRRIGGLAGGLFAINVVARLVVRVAFPDDAGRQDWAALITFATVGVAMAIMAVNWARRRPAGASIADLAGAAAAGGLLSILIGPLISGTSPFVEGIGGLFGQFGMFAGFAGGGVLIGILSLIMLGQDYKSRSLQRFAESRLTRPRRI